MGTDRRVLLLALSGIRVQNAQLLRLGLTLPGFVERSRVIASLPSLGLLTLAAHTPPGWEVVYREASEDATDDVDFAAGFDLVAISALSPRAAEAYALARALRDAGVPAVLGGLHATAVPDEAARHVASVVAGEGEPVWADVLADAAAGRLRPLYRARHPFDLARARTPRYDLLDPARYNRLTLQTTRGCPRACRFCGASRLLGPYRRKPLALVERELEAILARWPRPFLELADDNTFLDPAWSRGLARLLGRHPVRWFTETDLSVADDPALLDALAASGCAQLLIGLESPSDAALAGVDPAGWKRAQRARCGAAVARIQQRGIAVTGCFLVGLDAEDADVFRRTRDFAEELGLAEVQVTVATPFPGTELHARLLREGRLPDPAPWSACTLFDVTFEPAGMSAEELEHGFRWLVGELYAEEATARRRRRFGACRREQRRRVG